MEKKKDTWPVCDITLIPTQFQNFILRCIDQMSSYSNRLGKLIFRLKWFIHYSLWVTLLVLTAILKFWLDLAPLPVCELRVERLGCLTVISLFFKSINYLLIILEGLFFSAKPSVISFLTFCLPNCYLFQSKSTNCQSKRN